MTVVTLFTGKNGVLKECKANGHAGFSKKGTDIVCSAVTILLRTAVELLSQMKDVKLSTEAFPRGTLAFLVEMKESCLDFETESRLRCIADFLRQGFASLAKEFPENLCFSEESVQREIKV